MNGLQVALVFCLAAVVVLGAVVAYFGHRIRLLGDKVSDLETLSGIDQNNINALVSAISVIEVDLVAVKKSTGLMA